MLRRLPFLLFWSRCCFAQSRLGAGRRSDAFRDHQRPSGAVIPFAMVSLRDTEPALFEVLPGFGGLYTAPNSDLLLRRHRFVSRIRKSGASGIALTVGPSKF